MAEAANLDVKVNFSSPGASSASQAVRMLGNQLLMATDAGRSASIAMNSLHQAMRLMGGSFAKAGPIVVGVTAAVIAAIYVFNKLSGDSEKLAKKLKEQADSATDLSRSYEEGIKSVREYGKQIGSIPPHLEAYVKAQREAKIATDELAASVKLQLIQALNQQAVKIQDQISDQRLFIQQLREESTLLAKTAIAIKGKGEALAKANRRLQELETNLSQTNAKLRQEEAAVVSLRKGYSSINSEIKDKIEISKEAAKAAEEAMKLEKAQVKEYEGLMVGLTKGIGQSVGDAFTQMMFHGENFTENLAENFKKMAESIIADIIRIQIQYALISAMTGGTGSFFGGFAMAEGGAMVVDRPTLFMAGEAGPELATFTPLSKMPAGSPKSSAPSTITIGTVVTNVHGVQNPDRIADQVGLKILERIRGRGEIGFTR